jgi:hypothetical protein
VILMDHCRTFPDVGPQTQAVALQQSRLAHSYLVPFSVYRKRSLRDLDAHLVQVPQQVGGVLVHPIGTGALEFVLTIAAR